jgi:hypothetical protein
MKIKNIKLININVRSFLKRNDFKDRLRSAFMISSPRLEFLTGLNRIIILNIFGLNRILECVLSDPVNYFR